MVKNGKKKCYEDLVGTFVHARLYDEDHPEWQLCKVVSICKAGLKVRSKRSKELHLIPNSEVAEDVRVKGAFIPWEDEQKAYDGTLVAIIFTVYL